MKKLMLLVFTVLMVIFATSVFAAPDGASCTTGDDCDNGLCVVSSGGVKKCDSECSSSFVPGCSDDDMGIGYGDQKSCVINEAGNTVCAAGLYTWSNDDPGTKYGTCVGHDGFTCDPDGSETSYFSDGICVDDDCLYGADSYKDVVRCSASNFEDGCTGNDGCECLEFAPHGPYIWGVTGICENGACADCTWEVCGDGIDNDCDGETDEVLTSCSADKDGDGYEDGVYPMWSVTACSCINKQGHSSYEDEKLIQPGDCDGDNPDVHPGVAEICDDGIDNDCDGQADCGSCSYGTEKWCGDTSIGACSVVKQECVYTSSGTQWTACQAVFPKNEVCTNFQDDDCDGLLPEDDSDCGGSSECTYDDQCAADNLCIDQTCVMGCIDPDGEDTTTKSTTTYYDTSDEPGSYEDICDGTDKVIEGTCVPGFFMDANGHGNKLETKTIDCAAGATCSNGACSGGAYVPCGNGDPDTGETCDDSNTAPGDGCSATCTVESGYDCGTDFPSVCTPLQTGCSSTNPCDYVECKSVACNSGNCVYTNLNDNSPCSNGGTCQSGTCVTTPPPTGDLELWYKFNGNFVDSSGKGRGGDPNTAVSTSGNVATFDGGDYIYVQQFTFSGSHLSLAAWVKLSSAPNEDPRIISKGPSTSYQNWALLIEDTGCIPRFRVGPSSGTGSPFQAIGSKNVCDNEWHLIVGTYDTGAMKLYIDGVQDGSATANTNLYSSNAPVWIGDQPDSKGSRPFTGSIDEVRVYSETLSPGVISSMCSEKGCPGGTGGGTETVCSNGVDDDSDGSIDCADSDCNGAYCASGKTCQSNTCQSSTPPPADNLLLHYKFNGGHTNEIGGTSIVTGTLNYGTGIDGQQAATFSSGDHVYTGALNVPASAMSISAWFKMGPITTTDPRIISKGATTSFQDWALLIDDDYCRPTFRVGVGNVLRSVTAGAGNYVCDNRWHHLVGTYDGSTMRLYLDKISVGTLNIQGTVPTSNSQVWIGDQPTVSGRQFIGQLDDVRVYGKTLSTTDINSLCAMGSCSYQTNNGPGSGCTPLTKSAACGSRTCGSRSDNCGGTHVCGYCTSTQSCSTSGSCVTTTPGCTPSCGGKNCGSDGCNGICGTCGNGQSCSTGGICYTQYDETNYKSNFNGDQRFTNPTIRAQANELVLFTPGVQEKYFTVNVADDVIYYKGSFAFGNSPIWDPNGFTFDEQPTIALADNPTVPVYIENAGSVTLSLPPGTVGLRNGKTLESENYVIFYSCSCAESSGVCDYTDPNVLVNCHGNRWQLLQFDARMS